MTTSGRALRAAAAYARSTRRRNASGSRAKPVGVTLTSGTLSYYPAGNPAASVTISAATVGAGVIGTFDTTLLQNGGYFITLNATNSLGVTQNNVAYVTAIGEYKPAE